MSEPEFARVYRRFLALIAQPEPLGEAAVALCSRDAAAAPLASWIVAGHEEQAEARLGIYAHMYFTRLRDSLREDYESFARLVGDEAFALIAAQYLVQYPSDNPSLRYHGRHFPRFLREQRELIERLVGPLRPDLAELCALEWARIEVFDAPPAELLSPASLAPLAEHDWPELELQLIPAQRLLTCDHALEALWLACTRNETARTRTCTRAETEHGLGLATRLRGVPSRRPSR
jgi:hypothetical protein